ncbi:MAG: cation diffusion facilitator family transporter [Sulfuricurvum sp.]|uniref:cation diffusion facilitator family transporter n=1 Tax=Sulfuricurvum sp. TaxID=2025608 RepID=UPI0026297CD4|nr:cation diffusion facilitator family transporter [Sulfuricurvum sp.]MDD2368846.1 cation diffusion facilitator family transporter [Sulfuricurvum sp.]MDD2950242.1 cation diffusion facilitator family transporter [Sulfuricurvum sp.]MDD5119571.1 cation diffusion facilitator family transporter [Sulfuricurvum sp.]
MDHHHHHHHNHDSDISGGKLLFSVLLNVVITAAQFIGGILSGSLALLSDALHNFSDVMSLVISYYAHRLSHRPQNIRQTFGFKRAEILAALFNASVLIAVSLYLIVESIHRFLDPQAIDSTWVMALAALGIAVNGLSAWLLHRDAGHNLNIRSAYLHLMGDLMTSFAVLAGGAMIYFYGWYWIDPLLSLLISFYLIRSSYGIVRESGSMLMQFSPEHISVDTIVEKVKIFNSIESIHHIHLWQLDDETVFLEARLNFCEDLTLSATNSILHDLSHALEEIGISHTTFQCEIGKEGREQVLERCVHH